MAEIDSFEYWMKQLANRSESTRSHYRLFLSKFSKWMGKTPNELIEMERTARNRVGDPRENMVLEEKLRGFMRALEDLGNSVSTRKLAYSAVLSFFKLNRFPLNMNRGDRPSGGAKGSRIPEKAEIIRMVNAARSRTYRTAILLLKDSGLRVSDAVRLKWDDVEDLGDGFWGWSKIMTRKRRIMATPFVGPEATDALKQLDRNAENIFPVSAKTLSNAILLIVKQSGVKGVSAHGLRKFFNVELEAARIPREWRYQMMGKKTGAYDEKRMSKLFEAYRDAYDHLRVFGVSGSTAEFEALKRSVDRQETERQILLDRVNLLEKQVVTQREKIADMEQEIRNWKTVLMDFEKGLRFSMRERKT